MLLCKEGVLLLLFVACVTSQCNIADAGILNCDSCLFNGCSFCDGTCLNTTCPTGVTPTTTCPAVCFTAPEKNFCIYGPNHQVRNSGVCGDRNGRLESYIDINADDQNICRLAMQEDGPDCFFALQDWKCTVGCGTCPDPLRFNTTAPFAGAGPKPCQSVCDAVYSKCPKSMQTFVCGRGDWFDNSCSNDPGCYTRVGAVQNPEVYAQASVPPPTSPSSTVPAEVQPPAGNDEPNSNLWKILVGVIVGVLIVIIGIIFLAVFVIRRKRSRPSPNSPAIPSNYVGVALESRINSTNSSAHNTYAPMAPRAEPPADDKWNINYNEIVIEKEIGQGEFGVVYQGLWRNAKVVMKTVKLSSEAAVADFYKEINNLKKLRPHPNVCTFLGMCRDPLCIVTELVPKGSLSDLLANTRFGLDLPLALRMCNDVATGLNHIHYENILHCDLAARNLLVTDQLTLKVSDFGMSRLTNSGVYQVSNNKSFPVRWTSPETLVSRTFTKASDIWSLGIVMWEILERKYPYHRWDNETVITEVIDNHYRLPRPTTLAIPDKLWTLIMSCWALDPYDRPTASIICETLEMLQ